jgi:predicted amidohydrolase YtcJ
VTLFEKAENRFMADLILNNANVITMDPALPRAKRVAIRDGKISAVAGNDKLKGLRHKNTEVIDCKGETVLPGFIDAHFHLHGFAESLVTLNLEPRNNVRSISEMQERIKQLSQKIPPGTWIRGRGYNEFYLTEKRHPTRWDLDLAAPDHPIRILHRSGRAHVLNSLGLKLVHISKETADPPEGLIDRDIRTAEPTGLLYGMGDYLAKAIPPIENEQMEHGVSLASEELISFGITSICDASSRNNLLRWKTFQTWKERKLLKSRITVVLGKDGFSQYQRQNFSTQIEANQLRLGGVKIILHETTGRLSPSQAELNELVLNIHQSGMQAIIHAIEEKTIEAGSHAVELALQRSPRPDHRHRIEHCSVCTQPLARRLGSLGIMVVTQPSFIYYNGERYLKTVPDSNLKHLYPIATLINNGVKVVGSSDCPIVPLNPLIAIYSSVSRMAENGELVLPEERISPLEALRMYTDEAAKTTFEETIKGSITPGKLADLVVLNGDPTELPVDEIKDMKVEMTILGGEVVWDKMG